VIAELITTGVPLTLIAAWVIMAWLCKRREDRACREWLDDSAQVGDFRQWDEQLHGD
jgi:hypothetical protein